MNKPLFKGDTKSSLSTKYLNTNFQSGHSSNSNRSNLEMANPANLSFTPEQLSNLLKTSNAANTADKLPTFRDRARECDPMFEERNSFANHVSLLHSYIAAIPNLSEHDKK